MLRLYLEVAAVGRKVGMKGFVKDAGRIRRGVVGGIGSLRLKGVKGGSVRGGLDAQSIEVHSAGRLFHLPKGILAFVVIELMIISVGEAVN